MHTPPKYRKANFSCPHCNVYTSQSWLKEGQIRQLFPNNPEKIDICQCYACGRFSIWVNEKMAYPLVSTAPLPHEDMPKTVKKIYEEARSVAHLSPRAAAALLRVSLEELTKVLGEAEGNLHNRIRRLEEQGMSGAIIKNLHTVRIIANEVGAHAGVIALNNEDGPEIVDGLFFLVNVIVAETKARSRKIKELDEFSNKIKSHNLN